MNFLKRYIYTWFIDAASLASIVGLIVTVSSKDYAVIISLITLCLVLVIILISILIAINKTITRNHPEEYKKVSSFYIFQCDDGIHSTFETYRLIQCKRPILSKLEYKYKWSGDIFPKISSDNQLIEQLPPNNDPCRYDSAIIKFAKPLTYNESTVLHIKTENDDTDGKAKPYLECKLTSSIEIMQFKILLGYKPDTYSKVAIIKRRLIESETTSEFETMGSVSFNQKYKQYSHVILRPDAGYIYRIEWEK